MRACIATAARLGSRPCPAPRAAACPSVSLVNAQLWLHRLALQAGVDRGQWRDGLAGERWARTLLRWHAASRNAASHAACSLDPLEVAGSGHINVHINGPAIHFAGKRPHPTPAGATWQFRNVTLACTGNPSGPERRELSLATWLALLATALSCVATAAWWRGRPSLAGAAASPAAGAATGARRPHLQAHCMGHPPAPNCSTSGTSTSAAFRGHAGMPLQLDKLPEVAAARERGIVMEERIGRGARAWLRCTPGRPAQQALHGRSGSPRCCKPALPCLAGCRHVWRGVPRPHGPHRGDRGREGAAGALPPTLETTAALKAEPCRALAAGAKDGLATALLGPSHTCSRPASQCLRCMTVRVLSALAAAPSCSHWPAVPCFGAQARAAGDPGVPPRSQHLAPQLRRNSLPLHHSSAATAGALTGGWVRLRRTFCWHPALPGRLAAHPLPSLWPASPLPWAARCLLVASHAVPGCVAHH